MKWGMGIQIEMDYCKWLFHLQNITLYKIEPMNISSESIRRCYLIQYDYMVVHNDNFNSFEAI